MKEDFKRIVGEIDKRISYCKEFKLRGDFSSGWSGEESGPCCKRCELRDEHFTGRADAFKEKISCRDPFQINCSCHKEYRKVAGIARLRTLENVRAAVTCPRSFCKEDCDCEQKGFEFPKVSPNSVSEPQSDTTSLPEKE